MDFILIVSCFLTSKPGKGNVKQGTCKATEPFYIAIVSDDCPDYICKILKLGGGLCPPPKTPEIMGKIEVHTMLAFSSNLN